MTNSFLKCSKAKGCQDLTDLFCDVLEEGLDELRLAGEALAQHGVLGGDAHGAGVEVADPHHHAAHDHERRRGEAELLRAEQRGDDLLSDLEVVRAEGVRLAVASGELVEGEGIDLAAGLWNVRRAAVWALGWAIVTFFARIAITIAAYWGIVFLL